MGDRPAAALISVCEDGPLLVRGEFVLERIDGGEPIDPRRGAVALCRCGRSAIKPFCDGSHVIGRAAGAAGPVDD